MKNEKRIIFDLKSQNEKEMSWKCPEFPLDIERCLFVQQDTSYHTQNQTIYFHWQITKMDENNLSTVLIKVNLVTYW